jgi:hypothetical protein
MSTIEPDHPPAGETERGLAEALKRARIAQAERSGVIVDLRAAEIARLELLFDEVQKLVMQVPEVHRTLFEGGMVPGFPPRLWIDIIAFVEMGRDKRTYRFVREAREGQTVLAETAELAAMVDRITEYVAHRIVERERAFDEAGMPLAPLLPPARPPKPFAMPRAEVAAPVDVVPPTPVADLPKDTPEPAPTLEPPHEPALQPASAPVRRNGEWAVPRSSMRSTIGSLLVTYLSGLMTGGIVLGLVAWLTLTNGR